MPPATDRFIVETREFSYVFEDQDSQLRPLAQKWRASFGQFDPSIIQLALRYELLSRMVIVGVTPRDRDPRWRFIGDGHKWMGNYQFEGVGQPLAAMPDQEYGGWAAEFYKGVAASGQPRFDLRVRRADRRAFRAVALDRAGMPDAAGLLRSAGWGRGNSLTHTPSVPQRLHGSHLDNTPLGLNL